MLSRFINSFFLGCVLAATFSSSKASAEISEIESIVSLQEYIKEDGLALLNVGETLFSPSCMLADNQWRVHFVEQVNSLIQEQGVAQAIIDEVKALIVEMVPKITPETITPNIVAELQKLQIPVVGFSQRLFATTYAPNNGQIVNQHLLSLGIDLSQSLKYFDVIAYGNEKHDFQYGIIFTNKHPVGPAVVEFLNGIIKPSQLVVVDDDLEVLKEIESVLEPLNISFVGLRYGRTDTRKMAFDSNIANIQFFSFIEYNRLLSDEEAMNILLDTPEVDYQLMLQNWILAKTQ